MISTFLRPCLTGLIASQFLMGGFALAAPKEDVAAASMEWAGALGENDPDKVLPFYAKDAVLWGTISPTVRSNPAALREYFVNAFKALPGLEVAFGEQVIRVYGGTAHHTGYHTFSFVMDGESDALAARGHLS